MSGSTGYTTQLQHWLDLLGTGDDEARGRLIEHACERTRRLARKMIRQFPRVHRWEETDDVLTEVLTKLHRSLESVRPESPRHFHNLAAMQIRRVLIDMSRRHALRGAQHATAGVDADGNRRLPPDKADPSSEPANMLQWMEFHQQVDALPDEDRELFNLLCYEGLTQAAAAEVLGMSERTLRRRWQDARYRIARAINGEPRPDSQ